jgi:hypothetical protein
MRRASGRKWLGEFLSTLLAMTVTWAESMLVGSMWYLPHLVDDAQPFQRFYVALRARHHPVDRRGHPVLASLPRIPASVGIRFKGQ